MMGEWKELTDESKRRWDDIATYWDDYMGEESNRWHRELVRPHTEALLKVEEGQRVLDIACGNGNFSRRLAELGVKVTAIDYSSKMIECAKSRCSPYLDQIEFRVVDATDEEALMALGDEDFDHAVANMALMDIADITPLLKALNTLLRRGGTFVFSIPHPCFQPPGARKVTEVEDVAGTIRTRHSVQVQKYLQPEVFECLGIVGQPVPHFIFHRPISYYMNVCFAHGFSLDGCLEPTFTVERDATKFNWSHLPPILLLRFRKS